MAEVPDTVDDAIETLSDTPTTDEVYYETLPFQAREIASAAVSMAAAGGGGGGTPSVATFGPYHVTFESPGVDADGFPLETFPAGTVLWGAFFVPLVQFDPDNGIAIQDDANTVSWVSSNSTAPDDDGPFTYGASFVTPCALLIAETTVAAWVNPFGGPATTGEVDIYILASVPA